MPKCGLCLVAALAALLVLGAVRAEEEKKDADGDYYPRAWLNIDFRMIIDNNRLFKKYLDCFLQEHPLGCPRDIMQFKSLIPEMIKTNCAKCLPEHIDKFKEGVEYVCRARPEAFQEISHTKDPEGKLRKSFEKKFGAVNC